MVVAVGVLVGAENVDPVEPLTTGRYFAEPTFLLVFQALCIERALGIESHASTMIPKQKRIAPWLTRLIRQKESR